MGYLILAYLLAGVAIFISFDNHEMKKDVPYGNFTSIVSLRFHRTVGLALISIFWFPMFISSFFKDKTDDNHR
jgi:hypothetical protein